MKIGIEIFCSNTYCNRSLDKIYGEKVTLKSKYQCTCKLQGSSKNFVYRSFVEYDSPEEFHRYNKITFAKSDVKNLKKELTFKEQRSILKT